MEGDGGKEGGGTGEGKAAGKLRADENDNASRVHVRRFPPPSPVSSLYLFAILHLPLKASFVITEREEARKKEKDDRPSWFI